MSAEIGSGVSNVSMIIPNHTFADADLATGQVFSSDLLAAIKSIKHLSHVRFMGVLGTTYKPSYYREFSSRCFVSIGCASSREKPGDSMLYY